MNEEVKAHWGAVAPREIKIFQVFSSLFKA
jgi:hypothetical protein